MLTEKIDITSSTGRLASGIFSAPAKFERDMTYERTMAGLVKARARSRIDGHPRMMKAKLKMAMPLMAHEARVAKEVTEQLGVLVSTLDAYMDGGKAAKATCVAAVWETLRPATTSAARICQSTT